MMPNVGNQSGNVPTFQHFYPVLTSTQDEAWDVEWGNLRPTCGGLGAWHRVQHFGGSCQKVQEQDVYAFSGEDDYEPDQTASCELVVQELPSIGSKDHALGECKRCAFFSKGRCKNGKDCSHCHFPHEDRKRKNRRKTKVSGAQLENHEDYEGDLEDDDNVMTEAPATKTSAAFHSMPVSLPGQACCQGFDNMLVFGSVTPELERETSDAVVSSSLKATDEDDENEEETLDAPAEAFSSLWNETEKSPEFPPGEAESHDELLQLEEMEALEAEAARLEAEALAAESEAQRLLEQAMAAEEGCIEGPKDRMSETIAAFSSYYQDHILRSCGDAYWASLHASFSMAACGPASDLTPKEKTPTAGEAETTASSGEITSDAGATGHDFSTSSSNPDLTSSSDSDSTSICGDSPTAGLSEEMYSHRQERRHRQVHKQTSCATKPSKRSPLWPSRLPVDSPIAKTTSPSPGDTKKEKTSWASQARARRIAAAEDPEVAVVRQARGILNKLTDTNFETLYTQLVKCGIRTATQLEAVVLEIFEKATTQHGFLSMYVELCVRLNTHFQTEVIEGADFRKVLVGACQRTFEKNIQTQPEVDPNLCYEDRYEVELKFKTRMLGNLRFVGELLVRKLLAGKLLLAVSEELLSVGDGASIEAAATLLSVAGPAFDRKSWTFHPRLHAIFSMVRCMSKDQAIPMRVRCILKDLIDLRDAGWQK
jgi:hypothetical protein